MVAAAGCKALPPPPILPPHAATPADPVGSTTVMIVVGLAGEVLGDDGVGVALRVEHQTTDRTTFGGELTGGRGDEYEHEDGTAFRQWLVAARAYGRFTPAGSQDWALSYGVGLSHTTSGLVTGSLHGGLSGSYANAYAEPLFAVGVAGVVPLAHGDAFYKRPFPIQFGEAPVEPARPRGDFPLFVFPASTERTKLVPQADLILALDVGLVVPLGDTGNRISVDIGAGYALAADDTLGSLTAAEAQRFRAHPQAASP